ncbi:MAG TPA: alpha/beta hydrolase [Stellaceae bacterium]|jgi:pimeloyl-ACP methyl ester carboxylesterase|nr:alpha/beta hydrolase [Stellaceae bacterium]
MPMIPLAIPGGRSCALHCAVDDYLWPWQKPTPILMLHGFARNARFWNRWVPAIAETRRVYRPDLLGCGESEIPPADYRISAEAIGAQIIAALDALSLERVHWVGESSGGIVGLLLAAAHPERIASLVLCNTPTRISEEIKKIYALDRDNASAAMEAYGVGEWCRRTLGYRLDLDHADAALQAWVVAEMDRTRPDVAAALHDCFESVDTVPLLPSVTAPVLMLSGDKSRIAAASQQVFAERLPNGRLDLIAGYGHGVNLLQPERCARASLDFWRTIDLPS